MTKRPIAPKSDPKPETEGAGNLVHLLGLNTGASEATIFAAVEALSRKVEAKLAELVEREKAVALQEEALQQEADRARSELQAQGEAINKRQAELDKREAEIVGRAAQIAAHVAAHPAMIATWENEGGGHPDEIIAAEGEAPADPANPLAIFPGKAIELQSTEGRTRVTVTGPKSGRYRIGRAFGPEPVTLDLTEAELAAVHADPAFTVDAETTI